MRKDEEQHNHERDPAIADAMRAVTPRSAAGDARLAQLQARILRRAAPRVQARARWRRGGTGVDYAASWARAAVPLGVAAGIAAAVMVSRSAVPEMVADASSLGYEPGALFRAAVGEIGSGQLLELSDVPSTADVVVDRVVPQ
jgi:hypothetical protein